MNKTFTVYSFGCKVNQQEGAGLAALFARGGWREAAPAEEALLYIVNACTVTQTADKKARALLRRLRREHPGALLAVTGCYAQVSSEQIAACGLADIIAGLKERADLPALAEQCLNEKQSRSPNPEFRIDEERCLHGGQALIRVSDIAQAGSFAPLGPPARQKRARAYLKIEDGCGQFCHYCIVPLARGPVRSLPPQKALAAARELLRAGHRELVLSGIHIGAYGEDLGPGQNLPALIEHILALPGDFRLRLGSIEPRQFSTELLRIWAGEPRICPHLHIPLQSGSDAVLAAMNRNYRAADYAALLSQARALRPGCAVTTDVMAGYPGETPADFAATLNFCRSMAFARMHVFPYSRRPGTVAASLPQQTPHKEKTRRAALLGQLAAGLSAAYASSFIGAELEYLHEQEIALAGQSYYSGHSGNYLPLLLPATAPPPSGLLTVRALEYREGYLLCGPPLAPE